ncbi:MAG: tRNA (adenosine(37)-N6)-threonylcarbamoyltransferase complex dimerization subunit type 1 TsaB [Clostridia bacterium]|nr:tRNA (adenosine(37)-N6)-threonylcarbamoyltransferase complex dimerization subunit type 1 TsaB [Clostridia bacterium]
MNTLIIDTTSSTLYCILMRDTVLLDQQTKVGNQHSALLNQSIADLLARNNLTLTDIDTYAVCVGTGSFTGIRIGIGAVKGYTTVYSDAKLICYDSLHVLSYTVNKPVHCLMDAGRQLYYHAVYNRLVQITAPQVITAEQTQAIPQEDCVLFDNTIDYSPYICQLVADKIANNQYSHAIHPLYLRQPQAVEELDSNKLLSLQYIGKNDDKKS